MPALERILDPLCIVTRRPPVPASEKSNFMIRGADQLSFAADSNVPTAVHGEGQDRPFVALVRGAKAAPQDCAEVREDPSQGEHSALTIK
jgi:hypothetical protein